HAFETFVVPRELVHVLGDFAAGMSGDFERIRRYECTVQTGDGREVLMAWHNALRLSADGHIEGLLCAGEDISERKKVQARLAQSDRMATVGMLAAGVAHEINNPLTYILYNLEEVTERVPDLVHAVVQMRRLLVDKLGEDKASQALGPLEAVISQDALSELRECLDDASTGAERVRDIVRDLKVFSRVEDDTRSLIDLRAPVETAVSMAYNEIKYRARLVKELPSLPMVLANDGRLAQVFVNLLINAAQAIPEGDAANQQITVRAHHHDGVIEVSISDTGKGINPEVLPMIFEPFFTTKPAGVGSGLGLSICRNIIQGLGGEISAHSEPGQGTTFTVVLPVADATVVQPVIEPAPEKQVPAPAGRVLVVDDDPLLRSLVNRLLGSRHSVVLAASGAEAIALLEQDSAYNAVVCDVMMPEVTGVDVFRHVQQQHPELVPRFVFMTGGIFTPTTREFLMLNPRPTLEKPFEPRVLRELVAEILEQQQAGV
ncbi:MAG: ATP-binding protein, partial [Pseudomonadota bacterium]